MLALAVADLAEPSQRASLQVAVPGLAGEGERAGVAGAGLVRLAGSEQGLPGAVERLGFPVAAAGLPVQSQRLAVAFGGLIIAALPVADLAKHSQPVGLRPPIAYLAGRGERLPQVAGRLLIAALLTTGRAKFAQCVGHARQVAMLAEYSEDPPQELFCLLITAKLDVGETQVVLDNGFIPALAALFAGERGRLFIAVSRLPQSALVAVGSTDAHQRPALQIHAANVAGQGQCLLIAIGSLLVAILLGVEVAEGEQGFGLGGEVAAAASGI